MTRPDSSAWSLACGGACVFTLSVVLDRPRWQAALIVIALAVAVWAWQSTLITGAVGGIAGMFLTGFDVHGYGDIRITGRDDVRAAAILTGVLVASRGRRCQAEIPACRSGRGDFHAAGSGPNERSGDGIGRLGIRSPWQGDGIERLFPGQPIEETRNG